METVLEQFKKEQDRWPFAWEENAARLTREFVQDYPVDVIKDLSMYDYLISKKGIGNPYSFCRRLRYDLNTVCSMENAWPEKYLNGCTLNGEGVTPNIGLREFAIRNNRGDFFCL